MEIDDIAELHYITSLANLASIQEHGILPRNAVRHRKIEHSSVAEEEIQEMRSTRVLPNGARIHDHVNLYINARNPMLFRLLRQENPIPPEKLAVLLVSPQVMKNTGTWVSDGNLARQYTRVYPSPDGLSHIDRDFMFARYWIHSDPLEQSEKVRRRCAEILIPGQVEPEQILGAAVVSEDVAHQLRPNHPGWGIRVDPYMFFRGGP